jgi:hypothetical protein
MSLILDALRKLDRERSFRRNRTSNIAAEVVRTDGTRPRRKILRPFAALSITALLAAGLTYGVGVKVGFLPKLSPSAPADSPGPRQLAAPVPPSAGPVREVGEAMNRVPPKVQDRPEREEPAPAGASASGRRPDASALLPREPLRETKGVSKPGPLESENRAERGRGGSGPVPASPPVEPSTPRVSSTGGSGEPVHKVREQMNHVPPKIRARTEREEAGPGRVPASPPVEAKPLGQKQAAAPAPPGPVREAQGDGSQEHAKIQARPASKTPATFPAENPSAHRVVPEKAEVASGGRPSPATSPRRGSTVSPTALKISGIVWSEERSERRAVINGVFSTEGSVIEGVKVEEIYPTRVRFSHEGRFFEISVFE